MGTSFVTLTLLMMLIRVNTMLSCEGGYQDNKLFDFLAPSFSDIVAATQRRGVLEDPIIVLPSHSRRGAGGGGGVWTRGTMIREFLPSQTSVLPSNGLSDTMKPAAQIDDLENR
ncbi:hypothetical protein ElyMa_004884800 [Elysia marginata]|uniref:Secreted protein n=1 Tax=Elysia marginata TaxID=1093978 RepID=A0AAV4ISC0_9GAST|nr:hypothetical protein ElyMa_004884800 [Elysia marginata]